MFLDQGVSCDQNVDNLPFFYGTLPLLARATTEDWLLVFRMLVQFWPRITINKFN